MRGGMKWLLLVLIALVTLLGCAGAGPTPALGQLTVTTSWPHYNAGGDALARAASVRIGVVNLSGVEVASATQNRPNAVAPTGFDLVASSWFVVPGAYSFRITAFDGNDGSGVRLGQREFSVFLGPGQQM